jgi:hypothetical protein
MVLKKQHRTAVIPEIAACLDRDDRLNVSAVIRRGDPVDYKADTWWPGLCLDSSC